MRLIDAATLPYRLCVDDDGRKICYVQAEDIDKAPTIDPESLRPVGRWQKKPGCTYTAYECSVCHNFAIAGGTEYCPHCGAKMEDDYGTSTELLQWL